MRTRVLLAAALGALISVLAAAPAFGTVTHRSFVDPGVEIWGSIDTQNERHLYRVYVAPHSSNLHIDLTNWYRPDRDDFDCGPITDPYCNFNTAVAVELFRGPWMESATRRPRPNSLDRLSVRAFNSSVEASQEELTERLSYTARPGVYTLAVEGGMRSPSGHRPLIYSMRVAGSVFQECYRPLRVARIARSRMSYALSVYRRARSRGLRSRAASSYFRARRHLLSARRHIRFFNC